LRALAAAGAAGVEAAVSEAASSLPIGEVLGDVVQRLEAGASLVLSAPPGAGKTTVACPRKWMARLVC
jgi:HrpA-like RNA helicase